MSVNLISTLGAGSGVDLKALAEQLVEAERAPRKAIIDGRIEKTEARISGLSALRFGLSELRTAFAGLNDQSDFATLSSRISQPAAFAVTAGASAQAARYSINVTSIAAPQQSASAGYAAADTRLNGGNTTNPATFDLDITVGSAAPQTVSVADDTPAGVAAAITNAGLGLTARVINTGVGATPHRIVVTGEDGTAKSFSIALASGETAAVDFSGLPLQPATDAVIEVNGLPITRGSNTIDDVIPGLTFSLYAPTSGAATLDMTRDTTGAKDKIKALVDAYNVFEDVLQVVSDRDSEDEEFGGTLAGDSLIGTVRAMMRKLITSDSSTPGADLRAGRNVGLAFDRDGRLTLDESKLDAALANQYDQVVRLFSADTNNQSPLSTAPAGLAGDAMVKIDGLLKPTGLIQAQATSATAMADRYRDQLEALESRMEKLLARYTSQFAAMDSLVGQTNSLRENLKSSFDGMMAMYTGK
jgi:flagellar hook-associated protein 2